MIELGTPHCSSCLQSLNAHATFETLPRVFQYQTSVAYRYLGILLMDTIQKKILSYILLWKLS